MHNLALFCKSYILDLDRLKILKESVDKFNADKLPFYIVVPKSDLSLMKEVIENGKEDYELRFFTDEEVLGKDNDSPQTWADQQIIKLSFYKQNLCRFYICLDSDCYFINDFHAQDYMYNENTPYTIFHRKHSLYPYDQNVRIKNFFERDGVLYKYGTGIFTVLSSEVLKNFEEELSEKSLDFDEIIKMLPWEFQWYGEYVMTRKPYEIVLNDGNAKIFTFQHLYNADRKIYTTKDFVNQGYLAIVMQAGWVNDKIYKHSRFIRFHRAVNMFFYGVHERKGRPANLFKFIELYFRKFIRNPLREFLREV